MSKEYRWRWGFYFGGLLLMSLGISLSIKGQALGTSPWDVLHIGLFQQIGLTIGTWTVVIGLLIVGGSSLYLKAWPKIATWLNMLLIGPFVDFYNWLLPESSMFLTDITYFILGFFILGIGCGIYIAPNLGAGPRDTIMMILASKGYSVRVGRMVIEVIVTILGWLLGGPVGGGTIILAFGTGYVIQPTLFYFRKVLGNRIGKELL